MKIFLGFSRAETFISRSIRFFLRSPISHTYIRFYDEFLGIEMILHADHPGGIQIKDAAEFDAENETVEEYEIKHPNLYAAIRQGIKRIGKPYNYRALFGWAWTIGLQRWFKKKIERSPLQIPKKMICVDYAISILNDAEITLLSYNVLNPYTFLLWCRENHEKNKWLRHIRIRDE